MDFFTFANLSPLLLIIGPVTIIFLLSLRRDR